MQATWSWHLRPFLCLPCSPATTGCSIASGMSCRQQVKALAYVWPIC